MSTRFKILAVALSILLCRASNGKLQAAAQADDNFEQIREFLVNRPAIQSVLFRRDNSGATSLVHELRMLGLHGRPEKPEPFVVNHCAWDHEDFWFRTVEGPFQEAVMIGTNNSFFVGRAGSTIWEADHSHAVKSVIDNSAVSEVLADSFKNETTNKNPVAISVRTGEIQLSRVLNLGLFNIKNETLRFSGKKFEVALSSGEFGEGEFFMDQGRVSSAKFQIRGYDKHSVISYEYSQNSELPPFLPARVSERIYRKDGTFVRFGERFEFLHLKIADSPLPTSYFLPDQFYSRNEKRPTTLSVAE